MRAMIEENSLPKKPTGRPRGRPITLREWKCLRCGHKWWPRKPGRPQTCPKCRSPYWFKQKVRLTVKGRPKVSKKRVSKKPSHRKR